MEDIKTKLQEYANLKLQIANLEQKVEDMKPEIVAAVEQLNPEDHVVETDYGVFSMVAKRKYTYPEEIVAAEASVKELKKEAEAKGTATYVENPYLLFKPANIN